MLEPGEPSFIYPLKVWYKKTFDPFVSPIMMFVLHRIKSKSLNVETLVWPQVVCSARTRTN